MSCHGFLHVDTLGSRVGAKIMPGKQKKKMGGDWPGFFLPWAY